MKLQYVSDIHIELRKPKEIPLIVPREQSNGCLALCGDIGDPFSSQYETFIGVHSPLYRYVLVVSGNHEYYSARRQRTMREIDDQIEAVCAKFTNVIFMNKKEIVIENTKFIGCTLWSFVNKELESQMNDYNNIFVDSLRTNSGMHMFPDRKRRYLREFKRPLEYQDVNLLHQDMITWLEECIQKTPEPNIIVLTHHAPTEQMDRTPPSCGYSSDCEFLFTSKVSHWISGHTHITRQVSIGNTLCLSNCYGYPGDPCGHNPASVIDVL